jgi:hypothetical protein
MRIDASTILQGWSAQDRHGNMLTQFRMNETTIDGCETARTGTGYNIVKPPNTQHIIFTGILDGSGEAVTQRV